MANAKVIGVRRFLNVVFAIVVNPCIRGHFMSFWGYQASWPIKGTVRPDAKVDPVAIIMNLCEYPKYLCVVSSQ